MMKVRSRILRMKTSFSQKNAITAIKLIISKKIVEKKISSKNFKNQLIRSSQIQLMLKIKINNLRNQLRFR